MSLKCLIFLVTYNSSLNSCLFLSLYILKMIMSLDICLTNINIFESLYLCIARILKSLVLCIEMRQSRTFVLKSRHIQMHFQIFKSCLGNDFILRQLCLFLHIGRWRISVGRKAESS